MGCLFQVSIFTLLFLYCDILDFTHKKRYKISLILSASDGSYRHRITINPFKNIGRQVHQSRSGFVVSFGLACLPAQQRLPRAACIRHSCRMVLEVSTSRLCTTYNPWASCAALVMLFVLSYLVQNLRSRCQTLLVQSSLTFQPLKARQTIPNAPAPENLVWSVHHMRRIGVRPLLFAYSRRS